MRKDKPSRTALKVAFNIVTLGSKPGMEAILSSGIVDATRKLLVASGAAGEITVKWAQSQTSLAIYEAFEGPITVRDLPDPVPEADGVVIRVEATGICRSDWHGWMGHDPDIRLPHVPGHELAGVIETVGRDVTRWHPGDRVTLPFVCGCGRCPQCQDGHHQVCDQQFQPGFTHWGSFAERVAVRYADINLVRIPEVIDSVTAASGLNLWVPQE